MATKKLCVGTWRDRDGVRRTHKRGARSKPRAHVPTYYETLNEEARNRIALRYKGGVRE